MRHNKLDESPAGPDQLERMPAVKPSLTQVVCARRRSTLSIDSSAAFWQVSPATGETSSPIPTRSDATPPWASRPRPADCATLFDWGPVQMDDLPAVKDARRGPASKTGTSIDTSIRSTRFKSQSTVAWPAPPSPFAPPCANDGTAGCDNHYCDPTGLPGKHQNNRHETLT